MDSALRRAAVAVLRLALAAVSALTIALSLLRAPTHLLWMVAVGVTEWGYWLAPLAPLALWRRWRRLVGLPGWLLGLVAGLLAFGPVLGAALRARSLPSQVTSAFGDARPSARPGAAPRPAPLVAADLIRGVRSPEVRHDARRYRGPDGTELRLDLFRPLSPAASDAGAAGDSGPHRPAGLPVVVVIHGGGWESGDAGQLPEVNRYLAARGYAVAAIGYRLAPHHPYPAARDDVLAAVAYLKAHAEELGLDAGRFALYGRSAGGHLALLVGYTAADPAIRAVAALYPPTDMHWGYEHPAAKRVIDTRGVLERFLGGTPAAAGAQYDDASPLAFVGEGTPPTLLVHGTRDELVSPVNSRRLASALAGRGRPHLLLELPWATHGFEANIAGPGGQLWLYALERFLAATLTRRDATG